MQRLQGDYKDSRRAKIRLTALIFSRAILRIAKSIVILLPLILTQDFFLNNNLDQHSQRNCSCSVYEIESYKINNKFFDDYVIKNDHGFMDAV